MLRNALIERATEMDMMKKSQKGSRLMEMSNEREEYYLETLRLKQIVIELRYTTIPPVNWYKSILVVMIMMMVVVELAIPLSVWSSHYHHHFLLHNSSPVSCFHHTFLFCSFLFCAVLCCVVLCAVEKRCNKNDNANCPSKKCPQHLPLTVCERKSRWWRQVISNNKWCKKQAVAAVALAVVMPMVVAMSPRFISQLGRKRWYDHRSMPNHPLQEPTQPTLQHQAQPRPTPTRPQPPHHHRLPVVLSLPRKDVTSLSMLQYRLWWMINHRIHAVNNNTHQVMDTLPFYLYLT